MRKARRARVNLKTYRAPSISDALGQIKKDLGTDAVILHTRSYKQGGWLGIGGRRMVEITASSGVNVHHPLARKGKAPAPANPTSSQSRAALLKKAYAAGAVRAEPAPAPTREPVHAGANDAQNRGVDSDARADRRATEPREGQRPRIVIPGPPRIQTPDAPKSVAMPTSAGVGGAALAHPGGGALWDEISSIKRLVGQVLQSSKGNMAQPAMPEALFERYLKLIESEVASEIADEIVGAVRDELNADELAEEEIVHQAVLRRLAAFIPVTGEAPGVGRAPDGRPRTIAFVGPTGVGKTTTIAKLAAIYKLRHGRKVGLVTCDTYRIAAVEQLRTYANIISLPLKVALTPSEVASSCESLSDCDVILVDTAGRSQHDAGRLGELSSFLEAARPHETHLVLSGAANQAVIMRAAERFAVAKPNRVIFTKLDEVVNFGVVLNAAKSIGVRLSFVTTGQEVPDHIEPGRADRIARLVLEGGRPS
ncbi:MAG: flagellar biosynthesis protein FlhF [Phycisphaeraceae bacterium]|nr:MAG: flagellar biosynthesis protein FlhF [Phycisphaeraceae bacterium]